MSNRPPKSVILSEGVAGSANGYRHACLRKLIFGCNRFGIALKMYQRLNRHIENPLEIPLRAAKPSPQGKEGSHKRAQWEEGVS